MLKEKMILHYALQHVGLTHHILILYDKISKTLAKTNYLKN